MPKEYRCTEPGCEKCFLRSEHLSRHRLNHRPKQIYQCTTCPKRFVRKDLLRRHEKRHEKGMWFRQSGGFLESTSTPDPSVNPPPEAAAMFAVEHERDDLQAPSGNGQDDIQNDDQPVDLHPEIDTRNGIGDEWTQDNVAPLFFDPSFNFPDLPVDFEWLFDDMSTDFNFPGNGIALSAQSSMSATSASPPSFPVPAPNIPYASPSGFPSPSATPWATVQARVLEALESLSPDVLTSSFFYHSNLSQFYNLYFENYHPHFPILHKPTLDPTKAPPLLITAIVTLGSTLSNDADHFQTAVKIHDSLRYIIFNTEDFEPPASLWCMQTLLLIQAHEKMFSTRKHHQLAHIFHDAVITLMKRGVASSSERDTTTLEQSRHQWIETQSSNRTAFFGFVMDAQHSFMFGHTCVLSVHDVRLPLPCADSLWDCDNPEEWSRMMRKYPEPPGFLPVLKGLLAQTPIPPRCSDFGRLILLHGLFSVTAHLKARDSATLVVGQASSANSPRIGQMDSWKVTLERAMETWSFSLVSRSSSIALEASKPLHRMAYVAIYTDITDMHILAGAPSLLGSLRSESDRSRATARVRAWSEKPESKKALHHCLLLIQEIMFTGQEYRASKDNIQLRPWSLYLATLILWAYGFMAGETRSRARCSSHSAEEYLVRMLVSLRNGDGDEDIGSVAQQTCELLRAVRETLEGCRWELLQEAYETLGRLIEDGAGFARDSS